MIRPPAPSRSPIVCSSLPERWSLTGILFIALVFFSIAIVMPVSAAAVADFSADPMDGTAPLTVHFTDESTGAYSWTWFFGDGSITTQQNPAHTFSEPGDYDVSLVINGGASIAHKTITVTAPPLYGSGTGTSDDPFKISTGSEIVYLSTDSGNWSKYFVLNNDISLSAVSLGETIGNEIMPFTGNFDGQGHTIRDFVMDMSCSDNVGLFGSVGSGAEIRDLGVGTVYDGVCGRDNVGVLVGSNRGTITDCCATGNVTGNSVDESCSGVLVGNNRGTLTDCSAVGIVTGSSVEESCSGVLVGYNSGTITNCSAAGNVTGCLGYECCSGVLVGNNRGTLTDCSAMGTATASATGTGKNYAGCLVGYNNVGTLTNCSAAGNAIATASDNVESYAGGLVGYNDVGTLTDCSATGNATAGGDYAGGLVGYDDVGILTTCYATGSATAVGDSAGGLVGYSNYGTLTTCYATGNATAYDSAGGLIGYANDVTLTTCYATGYATAGHWEAGGLVGYSNYGTLTTCYATGSATAGSSAGVLVGFNSGGILTNCSATGAVSAGGRVGGLVGYNSGSLTNCSAMGTVTADSSTAGGLIGENTGTLTTCYATGNVTAYDSAGGLIGYNFGIISNCYATGTAYAESSAAGGLIGENYGTISNCYATGTATIDNYLYAGGLVGNNHGTIIDCFATGNATARVDYAGGLVGQNDGGTITNCYRHDNDGDNFDGIYVSDLVTFRDIAFLTGDEPANGLKWSTDIISTDADSSKVWRAFAYKGQYPVFQRQSFDTGTITVTSSPLGADIALNGVATGMKTNTTVPDLVEGEYKVTVSRAGYAVTPENVSVTLNGGGAEEVSFVLEGNETTRVLNLSAGWNMISVPVENATISLPTEAGAVYRYNGNIYESVVDLGSVAPGEGLWMAATGPCTITFTGTPLACYTEPASAGWNMIGSCSEEIESFGNHLSSDPAGKVSGQIYSYDPALGTYVTPASCTPGCGYWVSVSEGCEICLSLT